MDGLRGLFITGQWQGYLRKQLTSYHSGYNYSYKERPRKVTVCVTTAVSDKGHTQLVRLLMWRSNFEKKLVSTRATCSSIHTVHDEYTCI